MYHPADPHASGGSHYAFWLPKPPWAMDPVYTRLMNQTETNSFYDEPPEAEAPCWYNSDMEAAWQAGRAAGWREAQDARRNEEAN